MNGIKFKSSDVITIWGQRGSGKTVMGKYVLLNWKKWLIYDAVGEFSQKPEKYGKVVYDLSEIDLENDKKIIFNPLNTPNDEQTHDEVAKFVWEHFQNSLFVTDEIHEYQYRKLTKYFKKIITQGRHFNIGVMGISQRYANVNPTITTQSQHLFVFRMFGRDEEVTKQFFGKKLDERFTNMPEHHFVYYNTGKTDVQFMKPLPEAIVKTL